MKIIFKIIAVVFGVLFLVSAGLQYNDPDSLVWILIWVLAGFLALGFVFKKISFPFHFSAGMIALVGFFYCYPDKFEGFEIGLGDIKNIEEGREAFGLLIIAIVLLLLGIAGWVSNKSKV